MQLTSKKALESRARRSAARVGLLVYKSRWRRHEGSVDNFGGFRLIDPNENKILDGERFDLSADDVIKMCSDPNIIR